MVQSTFLKYFGTPHNLISVRLQHASESEKSQSEISNDFQRLINDQYFHVAEKENVTLILSPDINVCSKNIFLVPSAFKNIQLRNKSR